MYIRWVMSKRKKKLKRIIMESKVLNKKNELLKLEVQKRDIEEKLILSKKQNQKNMCIKNLKIFGGVCNKLVPYVLVGTLSVGALKAMGGGLPFKKDTVTISKTYFVESKIDGEINARETYSFISSSSNKLILYFPWKLGNDSLYYRKIREYDSSILSDVKLYEAILTNNIAYITNMSQYKERIETSNYIGTNLESDNDYIIDAYIVVCKEDEVINYIENDESNNFTTMLNVLITIAAGAFINKHRKFRLKYYIQNLNQTYPITDLSPLKEELTTVKTKILSLQKGGRN